jgi:hypothetical protein
MRRRLFLGQLFLTACLLFLPVLKVESVQIAAPAPRGQTASALAIDEQIIAAAKKGSEIKANLLYLCDIIGPRLTGSRNLRKANDWALEKMKRYGLTDVHLEPWLMPEGWERGSVHARLIEPDNGRTLSMASLAWRPGTGGKIQGPVVVLKAANLKELAEFQGNLKGAIVLAGPPQKLLPLDQIDKLRGPITSAAAPGKLNRRTIGAMQELARARAELLQKEGAAVMLQDAGKHFGLLFTTGGWDSEDRPSAFSKLPALSVAHNHYEMLYRLATTLPPGKVRLELAVDNKFIPGPVAVYNTIGEIRGSEKPDEFVIVGAHLDSWDLGQGATDNGTGTTVVLETARILKQCGIRPKRTIRFILFTGEEQGLRGSKAYVVRHKGELPRISAALVHDTGTGRVIGIGAGHRPALKSLLETELVSLPKLGVTDLMAPFMGGSDHASFDRAGIPGFAMAQEIAGYRFTHHSQADTVDRINEDNLIQGAQVMAIVAVRIANLDKMLSREKK